MIIKMPNASAITRLRLANAVVTGNRNSNRVHSLQGSLEKKLEIYGNAYKTTASGGGADVEAYAHVNCQGCVVHKSPPTGYLNSDGSFTYTSGSGSAQNYSSSSVFKITANGPPSITNLAIYYNSLTSGATYTVTISGLTYVLAPGTFFRND